jgi:dTDP-glucose pyrophosphorylase
MSEIVGLIPAAGGGTRLYPFSRAVPKEMYPIMGKAVIEHCVENLKEGGVKKIFMVVGYQKGALMDYIGDGSLFDVDVAYVYQMQRGGLGHAILQGKNWINSTFVTLLGDSFIEPKDEINRLILAHKKEKPIATVLLFKVKDARGYGVVKFKEMSSGCGEIEKMIEKPTPEQAEEYRNGNGEFYALCGGYVFEPEIFSFIERTSPGAKNEIQITDAMAFALKDGKKVYGVVLEGKYLDVGKWRTIFNIEKELMEKVNLEGHVRDREALTEKVMKGAD